MHKGLIERVYSRLLRESSLDGLDTSGATAMVDAGYSKFDGVMGY